MKTNIRKGFTLIELLVVIAIIGILAAITVVSVQGPRNKARDTQSLANLRQVASVMEQYYGDNGAYPASISAWGALETALVDYGTPLPTSTNPTYNVSSTATGYCVFAESQVDNANMIRCKSGAQCGEVVDATGLAEGCGN